MPICGLLCTAQAFYQSLRVASPDTPRVLVLRVNKNTPDNTYCNEVTSLRLIGEATRLTCIDCLFAKTIIVPFDCFMCELSMFIISVSLGLLYCLFMPCYKKGCSICKWERFYFCQRLVSVQFHFACSYN